MLQKLLDVSRKMVQHRALDPLLTYVLQAVLELLNAAYGALALSQDDGTLDYRVMQDRCGGVSQGPPEPASQAILDSVVAQHEPLLIAAAGRDQMLPAFAPSCSVSTGVCAPTSILAPEALGHEPRLEQELAASSRDLGFAPLWPSVMCVPLISRGRALGALYVAGRPDRPAFDGDDLNTSLSLAAQVAVAIENAQLDEQRDAELRALREIRQALPQARVLLLTGFGEEERVPSAIQAGAMGYLLKGVSPEELVDAIRCVRCRQSALHPSVGPAQPAEPAGDGLSAREVQVLKLLARGLSNAAIAEQLHIAGSTVRFHVGNILGKLNLENRTQAALYALREGLASLED